jgi:hypothetical protein
LTHNQRKFAQFHLGFGGDITWPEKPSIEVAVELLGSNKIEFDLDGPPFGSVEATIRGMAAE